MCITWEVWAPADCNRDCIKMLANWNSRYSSHQGSSGRILWTSQASACHRPAHMDAAFAACAQTMKQLAEALP
jgi:hypothetical protein